jgi:hypothetical protein
VSSELTKDFTGRCLCGAIRFSGCWTGDQLRACHCGQCRRWSGHVWAGASARDLKFEGEPRWFRSSEGAERGFCPACGSSLFWHRIGSDVIDVAPAAVDAPTGLALAGHIFVADKGDYYEIPDDLPQWPQG